MLTTCGSLKARFYSDLDVFRTNLWHPHFSMSAVKAFALIDMNLPENFQHDIYFFYLALIHFLQFCFLLLISGDVKQHSDCVLIINNSSVTDCTATLGSYKSKPLTDGDRSSPRMYSNKMFLQRLASQKWDAVAWAPHRSSISVTCSQGSGEKATCQRSYLSNRK